MNNKEMSDLFPELVELNLQVEDARTLGYAYLRAADYLKKNFVESNKMAAHNKAYNEKLKGLRPEHPYNHKKKQPVTVEDIDAEIDKLISLLNEKRS